MTNLNASQFQAPNNTAGDDLEVGAGNQINYADTSSDADLKTAQLRFDQTKGLLTLVRVGGELLETTGFMVASQLGKGPQGKKGKRGKAGRDGRDGADGETGVAGCAGANGVNGVEGPQGPQGPDGATGLQGYLGDRGDKGERGDTGPVGPTGPDGVIGMDGASCIRGATGPTGPTPKATAIFSATMPTDMSYFAWCTPAIKGQTRPVIQKYQPLNLTITKPTVTSKQFGSSRVYIADFYIKATMTGGSGNYQYVWSFPTVKGTVFSASGKQLHVKYTTSIASGERSTTSQSVSLTVYDVGQPVKPSIISSTTYTINTVG